jgi:hypothetical protein
VIKANGGHGVIGQSAACHVEVVVNSRVLANAVCMEDAHTEVHQMCNNAVVLHVPRGVHGEIGASARPAAAVERRSGLVNAQCMVDAGTVAIRKPKSAIKIHAVPNGCHGANAQSLAAKESKHVTVVVSPLLATRTNQNQKPKPKNARDTCPHVPLGRTGSRGAHVLPLAVEALKAGNVHANPKEPQPMPALAILQKLLHVHQSHARLGANGNHGANAVSLAETAHKLGRGRAVEVKTVLANRRRANRATRDHVILGRVGRNGQNVQHYAVVDPETELGNVLKTTVVRV